VTAHRIESTSPAADTGVAGEVAVPAFGARLARAVQERESQVVLGLDPDPIRLWPRAIELAGGPGDPPAAPAERAALAVAIHCRLAIEAAGEHCVAVKPQLACFERLGPPGMTAFADVVARAQERGLIVLADGKRGDVGISAAAYAQAFFGRTPTPYGDVRGYGVDALTVNPLLGSDSLLPFAAAARERGGGLFVLVRTSNPDAAELQDLSLAEGGTVSERVAAIVARLGDEDPGASIASVGAVVGATAPEQLARLREAMPRAPFLLPGIGAQGGRVEDLAAAFAPGRAGGLASASRGIVDAYRERGGDPARAAHAEAARLRERAWALAG
jgi:orotidine-5'-phosphate decarboxylase